MHRIILVPIMQTPLMLGLQCYMALATPCVTVGMLLVWSGVHVQFTLLLFPDCNKPALHAIHEEPSSLYSSRRVINSLRPRRLVFLILSVCL